MENKKKINIPNLLTLFRILIALVIIILAFVDFKFGTKISYATVHFDNFDVKYGLLRIIMFGLFIIATITDKIDGVVARKYHQETSFGKFLDPIADKILHNSILIYFVAIDNLLLVVPMLFIARDLIVDGLRMNCAAKNIIIAASRFGKIKTVAQVIEIIAIFVFFPIGLHIHWVLIIVESITIISVVLTLLSGIDYVVKNFNKIKE